MATIKAVIFDLDGVLIESGDWHYQALSEALSRHGFRLTREDHSRYCEGLSTPEKLKALTAAKGLPADLHPDIAGLKQRYTVELIRKNCRPCETRIAMLSRLRAENYRLACASNSTRRNLELLLDVSGLSGHLDLCLSGEDAASFKPDPGIYRAAFAGLGLEPGDCLVLEDHPVGLKAAYASGAHVARVENINEVCYTFVRAHITAAERLK